MRSSSGPLRRRRWRARSASRAAAAPRGRVPARARVRGGDEHEARREDRRALAADDRHAAVLQRLAQRLERRPRELGQLVEEQHAVVGEARLAGHRAPRRRRPARRREIVWCGARNGRSRHEPAAAMQPGDAVDARDLERLGARDSGGRIDGRRRASIVLPTPGGPESSRLWPPAAAIVSALDDVGVAADVGEVEVGAPGARGTPVVAVGRRRRARRRAGSRRPRARLAGARATSRPSTSAASSARSRGTTSPPSPARAAPSATASAPRHGRSSPPSDELAEDRAALERLGRDLAAGGEHRRRRSRGRSPGPALRSDAGARLTVSALERELEARVEDRRAHALARLAHGAVGEADDREVRQAGAHVDLDGDAARLEAVDGEGGDAGEHGRPR